MRLKFSIWVAFSAMMLAMVFLTGGYSRALIKAKFKPLFHTHSVKTANDVSDCFLAISDIHLHYGKNQYDAYSRSGDSGDDLWQAARSKIRELISLRKPKFIVLLGDLPAHTEDRNAAMQDIGMVLDSVKNVAGNIPVIYVPGNNDSYKHNSTFSLDTIRTRSACNNWPFLHTGQPGNNWLATADSSLGYYSCYPLGSKKGLRVIVLNSVVFYVSDKQDTQHIPVEMNWLKSQLEDARKNHDSVLMVMHVPPGEDITSKTQYFWSLPLQDTFLDLTYRYRSNIIGELTSHTHIGGIKRLYDSDSSEKYAALQLSIPGIAPGHGNYPGIELIDYNRDNYSLVNFEIFYNRYDTARQKGTTIKSWGNAQFNFATTFDMPAGSSLYNFAGSHLTADKRNKISQAINNTPLAGMLYGGDVKYEK